MSYIIIHTTSKKVSKVLYNLEKDNKKFFVLNLGNSQSSDTKVMKNNGFVLTYVAGLYKKHPNEVYVWIADRIMLRDFPDKCVEGGKWLNGAEKGGRNLKFVPKAIGMTKEELEKIKLNYEMK